MTALLKSYGISPPWKKSLTVFMTPSPIILQLSLKNKLVYPSVPGLLSAYIPLKAL